MSVSLLSSSISLSASASFFSPCVLPGGITRRPADWEDWFHCASTVPAAFIDFRLGRAIKGHSVILELNIAKDAGEAAGEAALQVVGTLHNIDLFACFQIKQIMVIPSLSSARKEFNLFFQSASEFIHRLFSHIQFISKSNGPWHRSSLMQRLIFNHSGII